MDSKPRVGLFGLNVLANHYPPLHGLRVLAVIGVLQVHVSVILASQGLLPSRTLHLVSLMVWFGMDCFFVLSGFLIGSMLLQETDDTEKPTRVKRFYLRRAFRTFPIYYVVLLSLVVLFPNPHATKLSLARELTYTANYFLNWKQEYMSWGWSLCVEEHFYLAVPLVILGLRFLRSDRARLLALAALFLSPLAWRVLTWRFSEGAWDADRIFATFFVRTHLRYDVLVTGIALAYLQRRKRAELRVLFAKPWVRRLMFAIGASCLAFLMMPPSLHPGIAWTLLAWGTVTGVMYAAFILLLLNHDGRVSRALGARVFLPIATLAYGTYLVHIPVIDHVIMPIARTLLRGVRAPISVVWPISVLLALACSLAVAYLLHLVVEKPALWVRDRFVP